MNLLMILSETQVEGEVVIDDTWYSPGVVGFVATFGMGALAVLLIFDLVRRIRRVRYRAEIVQKLEQEEQGLPVQNSNEGFTRSKPERPTPPDKPQR